MKSAYWRRNFRSCQKRFEPRRERALETPEDKRDTVQKFLAQKLGDKLKVTPKEVEKILQESDRATSTELEKKIDGWVRLQRSFQKYSGALGYWAPSCHAPITTRQCRESRPQSRARTSHDTQCTRED